MLLPTYSNHGLGTRVGKTENSVSNTFRRSGAYVTDPVLGDGTASYTPGISVRSGGNVRYQHTGLKNTDSQTSPAQSVAASRVYDAFGNLVSFSGTWSGPFGYAGNFGYQQDASGLKLLGHRYYDPSTGRFLTRDPIKDGRNWYAYGAGEAAPTTTADPSGQAAKVVIIAVVVVCVLTFLLIRELTKAHKSGQASGDERRQELIDLAIYEAATPRQNESQAGGGDPSMWQDGSTPSVGNPAGDGDNINRALVETGKVAVEGMAFQGDLISIVLKPGKAFKELVEIIKDIPKEWGKDLIWDAFLDVLPWTRQERNLRWSRI